MQLSGIGQSPGGASPQDAHPQPAWIDLTYQGELSPCLAASVTINTCILDFLLPLDVQTRLQRSPKGGQRRQLAGYVMWKDALMP